MRLIASVLLCVGIALAVAGCNPVNEERLVNFGIGTKLSDSNIATSTNELNTYLRYLCAQTEMGRLTGEGPDVQVECDKRPFGAAASTLLVRAGFNDIDDRCDSYLAWLNSRRRNQNAGIAQITDTRNFTEALLTTTGVSVKPLAIVGLALGLAANSFNNYYSRLILEVEKSTVEVLVREKRLHYRNNFNKISGQILFKPDIVFVLREYLVICTPHFIENLVNQRARDSVAGNMPADKRDPEQITASIVSRGLIKSIPKGGARDTLPPQPEGKYITGGKNGVENKIPRPFGKDIQSNLCVPHTGYFGPKTRAAIKTAKLAAKQGTLHNEKPPFDNVEDQIISNKEAGIFQDANACEKDKQGTNRGYKNAFEKFRFADEKAVKELQDKLNTCGVGKKLTLFGKFDPPTREIIVAVKKAADDAAKKTFSSPTPGELSAGSYEYIGFKCH